MARDVVTKRESLSQLNESKSNLLSMDNVLSALLGTQCCIALSLTPLISRHCNLFPDQMHVLRILVVCVHQHVSSCAAVEAKHRYCACTRISKLWQTL